MSEPEKLFKWKVCDDDPNAVEILEINDVQTGGLPVRLLDSAKLADRTDLTKLTVPKEIAGKRVVAIGARAFCRCSSLTAIKLPKGPRKIGGFEFYDIPDD